MAAFLFFVVFVGQFEEAAIIRMFLVFCAEAPLAAIFGRIEAHAVVGALF